MTKKGKIYKEHDKKRGKESVTQIRGHRNKGKEGAEKRSEGGK